MGMIEQILLQNKLQNEKRAERMGVIADKEAMVESDLKDVNGIGPATLEKLVNAGITTKAQLKEVGEDKLKEIIGNPLTAKAVLNSLKS